MTTDQTWLDKPTEPGLWWAKNPNGSMWDSPTYWTQEELNKWGKAYSGYRFARCDAKPPDPPQPDPPEPVLPDVRPVFNQHGHKLFVCCTCNHEYTVEGNSGVNCCDQCGTGRWCREARESDIRPLHADADADELRARLNEWETLFGCESPHDSHAGEKSALGREQARANVAENRVTALEDERDELLSEVQHLQPELARVTQNWNAVREDRRKMEAELTELRKQPADRELLADVEDQLEKDIDRMECDDRVARIDVAGVRDLLARVRATIDRAATFTSDVRERVQNLINILLQGGINEWGIKRETLGQLLQDVTASNPVKPQSENYSMQYSDPPLSKSLRERCIKELNLLLAVADDFLHPLSRKRAEQLIADLQAEPDDETRAIQSDHDLMKQIRKSADDIASGRVMSSAPDPQGITREQENRIVDGIFTMDPADCATPDKWKAACVAVLRRELGTSPPAREPVVTVEMLERIKRYMAECANWPFARDFEAEEIINDVKTALDKMQAARDKLRERGDEA